MATVPLLCLTLQANITELEVSIPSKLHNALIGSKGRFVRSIMEECGGVHIHFPTEGSGIDKVTIRGPAEEVQKAKQQLLALAEEKVGAAPLPPGWQAHTKRFMGSWAVGFPLRLKGSTFQTSVSTCRHS